jgi:protein TonB
MAEQQAPEHRHYDPLTSDGPRRKKGGLGAFGIATLVVVGLHAALFAYLAKQKFEAVMKEYHDDAVDVELPPPPPLPIPPVKERVEQTAPPVISNVPPVPSNPPARASVITKPDWARKPTGEDMARYYPDRAQRMEVGGRATLSCTVTAKGSLESCSVQSENPADYGFGDAALKLSRLFRMKPKTLDGAPVDGGQITIPIVFTVPR